MENIKTFKFVLGEETRPKIESFNNREDIQNSIFYEQYKKALECIADFVMQSPNDSQNQSDNADFTKQQSYNNIFVFIGDRGSGKTSCMLTVNDIITNKNNPDNPIINDLFKKVPEKENNEDTLILKVKKEKIRQEINEYYQNVRNTFSEYRFLNCGTIDPTLFDNKHNILELFIGTLYKKISDYIKKQDYFQYNNKYDKIVKAFQDVKEHLTLLMEARQQSEYEDALQDIHDLTSVIDIKHDIDTLINYYLSYMEESTSSRNAKLVLSIDDIDLNMSNAYTMIEQIRKYLSHPNLIILMAVKMGQLANVIRINYFNEFKVLLKQERDSHEINNNYQETINEIVERYMVKLFPLNQRIYLPDIEKILNKKMVVYKPGKYGKYTKIEDSDNEILKYQILNLIYLKFRILFYNTPQKTSYIVPRNLRELLNLITLLYKLDDAPTHVEAGRNQPFFKQYFENIWCKNNLDEQGQQIIRRLRKIRDAIGLNKTTIQLLHQRFMKVTDEDKTDNTDKEIESIVSPTNMMYNISLGDMIAYLSWLEKICYDDYDMKLLFAVKTFYSFKLYESYRNANYSSTEYQTPAKKEELTIINRDPLPFNLTEYEDILSGSFLNSQYIDVAPDERNIISRSRRIINVESISDLIKIISPYKELLPWNDDQIKMLHEKYQNQIPELLQKNLEFFMLTSAYVADAKYIKETKDSSPIEQSKNFRTQKAIYYKFKVAQNRKYLCFDVLSIFYNLLDVERTYQRYETYNPKSKWHKGTSYNGLYTNILKYICIGEFLDVLRVLDVQKIPTQKDMLTHINGQQNLEDNEQKSLENICGETWTSLSEEQHTTVKDAYEKCFYYIKEWNEKIAQEYEQKLRYKIHIRNVELIQQIAFLLELKRKDGSSDNISILKEIFNALGNFKIIIHNENNISFEFFNAVRDFLDDNLKYFQNNNDNNVFNKLYSSIPLK